MESKNKRGGSGRGQGRKKSKVKTAPLYARVNKKKLDDLRTWYDVDGLKKKIVAFVNDLHKQGEPKKAEYNKQFLKETE